MKYITSIIALVLLSISSITQATMIGDTVDVIFYGTDIGNDSAQFEIDLGPVTVVDGPSDIVNYNQIFDVNIEADSILVDFHIDGQFNDAPLVGLEVSSIDGNIKSVTIDTNFSGGWSFDAHSVYFDWTGAYIEPDSYLNASITFVPVPATVWLFGSGLIGLFGIARRKKA